MMLEGYMAPVTHSLLARFPFVQLSLGFASLNMDWRSSDGSEA